MATVQASAERPSSDVDEQLSPAQSAGNPCDQQEYGDPLDTFVPDPAGMAPLCGEEEFAAVLENMVADQAPRLFAVVLEYGQRVDAVVAAWGIAFDHHAEVVSANGQRRMRLQAPQHALRHFQLGTSIRARLVWFDPYAATPAEDHDAA